jgi:MFS-type transporter involved in bile tolerance (Atg22 family)
MNTTLNLIILFIIISYIAVWGYAIYDVTKTKFKSKNIKIIWTVLIFFLPVSAIFYFFYKKEII